MRKVIHYLGPHLKTAVTLQVALSPVKSAMALDLVQMDDISATSAALTFVQTVVARQDSSMKLQNLYLC